MQNNLVRKGIIFVVVLALLLSTGNIGISDIKKDNTLKEFEKQEKITEQELKHCDCNGQSNIIETIPTMISVAESKLIQQLKISKKTGNTNSIKNIVD